MLALVGFIAFLIGLVINIVNGNPPHALNLWTWLFAGAALVALHLATGWRSDWRRK